MKVIVNSSISQCDLFTLLSCGGPWGKTWGQLWQQLLSTVGSPGRLCFRQPFWFVKVILRDAVSGWWYAQEVDVHSRRKPGMNQVRQEPVPICQTVRLQGLEKDTARQIHNDQIQFGNSGVWVWMPCMFGCTGCTVLCLGLQIRWVIYCCPPTAQLLLYVSKLALFLQASCQPSAQHDSVRSHPKQMREMEWMWSVAMTTGSTEAAVCCHV